MAIGNIVDSAPVAASPAPTPDTSAAPTPQPDATTAAQPTQAIQAPQTPTAQAPPPQNPQAPATAPARSLPPSRNTGVHGILGGVLMGALAGGVAHIARATGNGLKSFGENSGIGQNIQNQKLKRAAEQQAMQLEKQKAADTHTAAMDEHTESMVRVNSMSLDNMHKSAENAHLDQMYPMQEADARNTLLKQHEEQNAVDRDMLSTLESIGVHVDTSHFTEGGPFDQLTPDHATQIAQGKQIALNNGETGPKADLAFV